MNWKIVIGVAIGATLGTVGAHSYLNGFNPERTLVVGLVSFLGAVFVGYVATLGKRK